MIHPLFNLKKKNFDQLYNMKFQSFTFCLIISIINKVQNVSEIISISE